MFMYNFGKICVLCVKRLFSIDLRYFESYFSSRYDLSIYFHVKSQETFTWPGH